LGQEPHPLRAPTARRQLPDMPNARSEGHFAITTAARPQLPPPWPLQPQTTPPGAQVCVQDIRVSSHRPGASCLAGRSAFPQQRKWAQIRAGTNTAQHRQKTQEDPILRKQSPVFSLSRNLHPFHRSPLSAPARHPSHKVSPPRAPALARPIPPAAHSEPAPSAPASFFFLSAFGLRSGLTSAPAPPRLRL
jgi:hypothetical protein